MNRPTLLICCGLLILACACQLVNLAQSEITPTVLPTDTTKPEMTLTNTPVPGIPFSKDEVVVVPGIAASVGDGIATFTAGEEPNILKASMNGKIPHVEGKFCFSCFEEIKIGPRLKVPIDPYFLPKDAPGQYTVLNDMVIQGEIPENLGEYILSGDVGATLRKLENGFLLVEGAAYYVLEEVAERKPTEQPTERPTVIPKPSSTLEPTPLPIITRIRLEDKPDGEIMIEVLQGDYKLTTGMTARTGSSFSVEEQYMTFPVGLLIEVGPAGLTLKGENYPEGTQLFFEKQAQPKVVKDAVPETAQESPVPIGESQECEFDHGTQREVYTLKSPIISHPVKVDGKISSENEWSQAFCVDLRLHEGLDIDSTFTQRIRWWVQNDNENLYFLLRVPKKKDVAGVYVDYFWPKYNGIWEHSDGLYIKINGEYFDHGQWDEQNWFEDTELDPPGTIDLEADSSEDNEFYWFEIKRELDSGDPYDWAFIPGKTYGNNPSDSLITGIVLSEGFYNRNLKMTIGKP